MLRKLDRGIRVAAGFAEGSRGGGLPGLRMGFLRSGHVPAPLLRVGDPFRSPLQEGLEVTLLPPLEGLEGRSGEQVVDLLERTLVGGLSGELQVPLRGEGVDPRLAGLSDRRFRPTEIGLDAGPPVGGLDGALRRTAEVESLPEI